jgi:GxxExxY protein
MIENELSGLVIDICLKIHKMYGPGLLESVYETIFCYEWGKTGIPFTRQQNIPLYHQEIKLDIGFRSDVIIDNKLLVDFKSLEVIPPVHFKRFKTYLKLTKIKLGLILNFDVVLFKDGIFRIVNGLEDDVNYKYNH